MPVARAIGVLVFTLMAGCAGMTETRPDAMAQSAPPIADRPEAGPNAEDAIPAVRPPPESKEEARTALAPAEPRQATKAIPPPAKVPAKLVASPASVEQPRKIEAPVPAARPAEPPLDVAALTGRLRDTSAIGVFTKLALKNQVDDLLKQFRTHHEGGQKTSVASLRQPYNMLLLKVLSLVQDSDPSLARAISGSREAIWGILADPQKFKSAA